MGLVRKKSICIERINPRKITENVNTMNQQFFQDHRVDLKFSNCRLEKLKTRNSFESYKSQSKKLNVSLSVIKYELHKPHKN